MADDGARTSLSPDELAEQVALDLPDREAMSVLGVGIESIGGDMLPIEPEPTPKTDSPLTTMPIGINPSPLPPDELPIGINPPPPPPGELPIGINPPSDVEAKPGVPGEIGIQPVGPGQYPPETRPDT